MEMWSWVSIVESLVESAEGQRWNKELAPRIDLRLLPQFFVDVVPVVPVVFQLTPLGAGGILFCLYPTAENLSVAS